MTSRYDIPVIEDSTVYLSTFDTISVPPNNPIAAGIQHNEQHGRNSHCNFGIQERGIIDMCICTDVRDSRPGWAHPDCPKMLPQYDPGEVAAAYQSTQIVVVCDECGEECLMCDIITVDGTKLCQACFDDDYFICEHCNCVASLDDLNDDLDMELCDRCADEVIGVCDNCEDVIFAEYNEGWVDDNHIYCENCYEDNTFRCAWCGERFSDDEECGTSDVRLCGNCADDSTECECCGALIHQDDAHFYHDMCYCESCYDEHHNSHDSIYDYGDAPSLQFLCCDTEMSPVTFFGVEAEIDDGDDVYDCAEEISHIHQMWMTEDGSLGSSGIEVKTHPATFDYHMTEMPWEKMTSIAKQYGYRSHDTDTCGLHIHISKDGFGESRNKQDNAIARFVFMIDKFWPEMVKFSRRNKRDIDRWAMSYSLKNKETQEQIFEETIIKNGNGRHFCVNLRRGSTVEVRIFKGTLNVDTIKASIQLCEYMRLLATSRQLSELNEMDWGKFKADIPTGYVELINYLEKRRL